MHNPPTDNYRTESADTRLSSVPLANGYKDLSYLAYSSPYVS